MSDERTLGKHEVRLDHLEGDIAQIKVDIRQILEVLSEARGGWKTLLMVGGVSGAVGAALVKLLTVMKVLA